MTAPCEAAVDPSIDFALTRMLRQQEPFPMVVMNLAYDVLRTNDAALGLAHGPLCLRFFMVVTAFAAPQQITLEELRIESYFPVDEATRLACERLSLNYSYIDSNMSSSDEG